uniref:J domain-containing protein n=1 Tax=viral metagenome TaxID=1070528 RepID=A0A6C0EE00_9ZZZZ
MDSNLDLNIDNYSLDDILQLFRLSSDFDEADMKNAKKLVLKMHPDKSRLDAKYFLFFSKAYKVLYSIYEFKQKSQTQKIEDVEYENVEFNDSEIADDSKKKGLHNFFEKNKKLKSPQQFNKWFNKQFENNKLLSESDTNGYGDWLKSEEGLDEFGSNQKLSLSEMTRHIEKKKTEMRSLITYDETAIHDFYQNTSIRASALSGEAPKYYSSDIFSALPYQDLKQAHTETVIPVTYDDYKNKQKFNNINEIQQYRQTQDTTPLSEIQAREYLMNKSKMEEKEGTKLAYDLAKQVERSKQKNKAFWSNIMSIKN